MHCWSLSRRPPPQIMLWERKIQLEREMAEVMDPSVGTDVVGAMRREVHRMQLRLGDLGRLQERLIADMERSISKRETINTKVGVGGAAISRANE